MAIEKIDREKLFVSEPSPYMFGNSANKRTKDWNNDNWLKSRFHFSFAEYNDWDNSNFGVLRVMNDDLVQPSRGFGTHPHQDMEIMTYIVNGDLTHQDSTGNKETLGRGSVQFMTAGTGVYHSERNDNPTTPLRFIQMWVVPRQRGLEVNYGSYKGELQKRSSKIQHLASDVKSEANTPIKVNQDVNLHVSELKEGEAVSFKIAKGRQAYFLMVESDEKLVSVKSEAEGSGQCTHLQLRSHDAAKIKSGQNVTVTAPEGGKAHFLYMEMKAQ
eukprot:snap_masked-scaffold_13-processed-gene-6.26-mRNA-1 protein AED:0.01 eAED:0.01 QI:0/-1/0/1/-1/1/1/0/271